MKMWIVDSTLNWTAVFFFLFWFGGFMRWKVFVPFFSCSQCTRASKLPSKNSGKTFLL